VVLVAIIVETGEIVAGANSYISEADLIAYASARGYTFVGDVEVMIIQAMDYIESLNYQGWKVEKDQPLQWPRNGVNIDGYCIENDVIPQALINGLAQTAMAIDQGNSPLIDSPRKTIKEKVGEIEVQYSESSSSTVVNRKILVSLQKLLGNNYGSANTIKVGKG